MVLIRGVHPFGFRAAGEHRPGGPPRLRHVRKPDTSYDRAATFFRLPLYRLTDFRSAFIRLALYSPFEGPQFPA